MKIFRIDLAGIYLAAVTCTHGLESKHIRQLIVVYAWYGLFETQRYCFLGSIDDWITIGNDDELPRLVKAYVKHLGEESFYDFY